MLLRMDGKPVGRRGLFSLSTETVLVAGTSTIWRANPERVSIIICNWGNNLGAPSGILRIKCIPDQSGKIGLSASNGTPVGWLGTVQFDTQNVWTGQISITCEVADTYVTIHEIYDGTEG